MTNTQPLAPTGAELDAIDTIAKAKAAITAGRARLEGEP